MEESARCLCVPLMSSDLVRIPTTDMRGNFILLGSAVSSPQLEEAEWQGQASTPAGPQSLYSPQDTTCQQGWLARNSK